MLVIGDAGDPMALPHLSKKGRTVSFAVKHQDKTTKMGIGLEFLGAGLGHGVGMCQFGAMGMARQGAAAEEILAHYYPGCAVARDEGTP